MAQQYVVNARIDDYRAVLREPSRPPSRGGNTTALHAHYLRIGDDTYSFLACGSRRWVYKTDRVSFAFTIKSGYRNIVRETLRTIDAKGNVVVRGDRRHKPVLRTAPPKLPGSRRERRD
jgi:hypothetical protein